MTKRGTVVGQMDVEIGSRIRLARRARGYTQTTLGTAVGVTFQQMQKYETGKNRISVTRLHRIAEQLGMPLEHFTDGLEAKRAGTKTAAGALTPAKLLQTNDALRLITAFNKIKSAALRKHCVQLVQSLAREQNSD
jgi:transcriptional regulator with XRE-family HTH domain